MVWGIVLLYFYLSGRVASYLHPAFHIYTVISGAILALLAVVLLFTFPESKCGCESHGCSSSSGPFGGNLLSLFILVVPLLVATKVSQSGFGVTAVMNRGIVDNIADLPAYTPMMDPALPRLDGTVGEGTMMDPSLYLRKNESGQIMAETVDLLYAASDESMRSDFENKEVELIGQYIPARTGNANGDRFNLVRLFVMCCAADARPVGIAIQQPQHTDFPQMTWVKVHGKATFPVEGGRHVPVVVAESVTETEPPNESFIY